MVIDDSGCYSFKDRIFPIVELVYADDANFDDLSDVFVYVVE